MIGPSHTLVYELGGSNTGQSQAYSQLINPFTTGVSVLIGRTHWDQIVTMLHSVM